MHINKEEVGRQSESAGRTRATMQDYTLPFLSMMIGPLAALTGKVPAWPESTKRISQLRLVLKFQSQRWLSGMFGPTTLNPVAVDIGPETVPDIATLQAHIAEMARAKEMFPEVKEFFFDDDTFTDDLPRAEEQARAVAPPAQMMPREPQAPLE